jgi:hypothetical protein
VTPVLHALCVSIWCFCIQHDIHLLVYWVPREYNTLADALSKHHDPGDWVFGWGQFQFLAREWVLFLFDLFAQYTHNTKAENFFFSGLACTSCLAVDAMSQSWMGLGRCWCFPPLSLIGRVIAKVLAERVEACLVVPATPGANF